MSKTRVQHFSSDELIERSGEILAQSIAESLSTGSVLLLLSGGSSVQVAAKAFFRLEETMVDLEQLTVSLVDERFGPPEHVESNQRALKEAGVLSTLKKGGGTWLPWLLDEDEEGPAAASRLSEQLDKAKQSTTTQLALLGLGADGHTAGWLPTQDEETFKVRYLNGVSVIYYQVDPRESDNPHRQRLTTTPPFLLDFDQLLLFVKGEEKRGALEECVRAEVPTHSLPGRLLFSQSPGPQLITDISGKL